MTALPSRRDKLLLRPVGEEVVVFDQATNRAYALSRAAGDVLNGCDGRTTSSALALSMHCSEDTIDVLLEQLRDVDLLVDPEVGVSRRVLIQRSALVGGGAVIASMIAPMAVAHASSAGGGGGGGVSGYSAAVLASGPYIYWRLDDTGTTAKDASGNGNNGAISGAVTEGVTGATKDGDSAITFAGGQVTGGGGDQPDSYSLECWFKSTSASGQLIGLNDPSRGLHDRSLGLSDGGKVAFFNFDGSFSPIESLSTYNDGIWHHVVATLSANPGTATIYVDGAQVAQQTNASAYDSYLGGQSWYVANGSPFDSLDGTVDEVAVYHYALTGAQAAAHHAAR